MGPSLSPGRRHAAKLHHWFLLVTCCSCTYGAPGPTDPRRRGRVRRLPYAAGSHSICRFRRYAKARAVGDPSQGVRTFPRRLSSIEKSEITLPFSRYIAIIDPLWIVMASFLERDCTKGVEEERANVEEGGRTFSREPPRASGFRPTTVTPPSSVGGPLDVGRNYAVTGKVKGGFIEASLPRGNPGGVGDGVGETSSRLMPYLITT